MESILPEIPNPPDLVFIILNITLASVFIGIFYFTYGIYLERKIVKTQTDIIAKSFTGDFQVLGLQQIVSLSPSHSPELQQADADAAKNNATLMKQAILVISVFFIASFGFAYYIARKNYVLFTPILKKALIVLVFIALTEFTFATLIAQNYITANPNAIKQGVLDAVASGLNIPY